MGVYQYLREAGFKESLKGPVVFSALLRIIEEFEASKDPVVVMPGFLVPEARPENYDLDIFKNNYVVFLPKTD